MKKMYLTFLMLTSFNTFGFFFCSYFKIKTKTVQDQIARISQFEQSKETQYNQFKEWISTNNVPTYKVKKALITTKLDFVIYENNPTYIFTLYALSQLKK